jgi:hypothetical protein
MRSTIKSSNHLALLQPRDGDRGRTRAPVRIVIDAVMRDVKKMPT